MIRFFITQKGELKEAKTLSSGCWIDMVSPTGNEFKNIVDMTGIPEDVLKPPLDENELPRAEKNGDLTIIIVHIPTEVNNNKASLATIPLGIFITKKYILTIALYDSMVLDDLRKGEVRNFSTKDKPRMVLQLLARMNFHYLRYLRCIEKEVDQLETSLSKSFKNEEIIKMLGYQKVLVYFNNSIMWNAQLLEKIHKGTAMQFSEKEAEFLDDIVIDCKQALESTKIFSNILSNTMDAYASMVSNNLNIVMKLLASVTIILSLPTMVASFYGMNLKLPFQDNPVAFTLVIIFSLFIAVTAALLFWNKKWL